MQPVAGTTGAPKLGSSARPGRATPPASRALGSMTPTPRRIGFCCTYVIPPEEVRGETARARQDALKAMNLSTATMAHLERLGPAGAAAKLDGIVRHNLQALGRQIAWVARRPPGERLLRLGSSILPGYTHPVARGVYREPQFRSVIEAGLARVGERAREAGIRIGMHPGPFCILGTQSPAALTNAVEELDYHAEIMALMGYGEGWHPHGAHVNIHVGARAAGTAAFRAHLARVSQTARNLVTVENDETSFGLDEVLELADTVPVVLDLHHHWIASRGEHIEPDDPRIARIVASWRGVRPLSHVSAPREALLPDHPRDRLPDFAALVAAGISGRDLMAHSDMMWNDALSALVARHLAWSDFEIEAKLKNLASTGLAAFLENPPRVAAALSRRA